MKEENKKSKKKVLLYYLILAACLLVIAAVTVTVIFTVNRPVNDNIIDVGQDDNNGGNNGDDNQGNTDGDNNGDDNQGGNNGDDNKDDNKPTGSDTSFGMPLASATVTTSYEFAYDTTLDRYCVHTGMDFEGAAGDSVAAVLDGTVTQLVTDSIIGENYVILSHTNGLTSTYKYIEAEEGLKVGDSVRRGDVIGKIAAAAGMEMKQGEHLHFEMQVNGKPADPNAYLNIIEK